MKKYTAIFTTFLIFSIFFAPTFIQAQEVSIVAENNCLNLVTSLRYKMRDSASKKDIWNLQTFLQKEKYLSSSPTGYFGNATLKAVKDFQKKYNITPTGLVGSITRAKILEISCASTTNTDTTNGPVNNIDNTNTTNTETTNNTTSTTTTENTTTTNDEILTAPNNSSLKVRTEGVVSNTANSATLRGNITAGARSATKGWFEVTKNSSVYKVSETLLSAKVAQPANGKFDSSVSGLTSNTVYYYRACAENVDLGQKSCGTTSYFTTPN